MSPALESAGTSREPADADDAASATGADARDGQLLNGRYRILHRLSAGGMGTVYRARALDSGDEIAIKILHAEYAHRRRVVQRFMREANIAAGLDNEHVVGVTESGEASGVPYLVMELLDGQDLRQLLRSEGALSPARAVGLMLDACKGARAAHEAGLVHRDLKPANIFIVRRGDGGEVAKILDFGVAKLRHLADSTGEGSLIGTLAYMAPEQVISAKSVDHRADIFALGLILREALSGEPLRRGERAEVLFRALYADVPPLRAQRPDVPEALDAVILQAVARDPERRYPNVAAFADALRPFAPADAALGAFGQSRKRAAGDVVTCVDSSIDEGPRLVLPSGATLPVAPEHSPRRLLQRGLLAALLVVAAGAWVARGLEGSSTAASPPLVQVIAASTPAVALSPRVRAEGATSLLEAPATPRRVEAVRPPPALVSSPPRAPSQPTTPRSAPQPRHARPPPAQDALTLPGVLFDSSNPYRSPPQRAPFAEGRPSAAARPSRDVAPRP